MSLRISSFLLFLGLLVIAPAVEAKNYELASQTSQSSFQQTQKRSDKEKKQLNRKRMINLLIGTSITVVLFGAFVFYHECNRGVDSAQDRKSSFQRFYQLPLDNASAALEKAIKEKWDDLSIVRLKDRKKDLEKVLQEAFQRHKDWAKSCNFLERWGIKKTWAELFESVKKLCIN